jgi:hypothetical protein
MAPLPSSRTIHRWLKRAGRISERKSQKAPNPTYPVLPCQAVNDVQELDFKGPFYLKDHAHKYYLVALRDKWSKRTALRAGKQEHGCDPGLFGLRLAEVGLSKVPENGQLSGFPRQ